MVMDSHFRTIRTGDEVFIPTLDRYQDSIQDIIFTEQGVGIRTMDPQFHPSDLVTGDSAIMSSEGDSLLVDNEFSDTVLRYISQMLMEEDMDGKPCMFNDPLALQAAEKSLYEAIGQKHPDSPDQHPLPIDSRDYSISGTSCDYGSNGNVSIGLRNQWHGGSFRETEPSVLQLPVLDDVASGSWEGSSFRSTFDSSSSVVNGNGTMDSSVSRLLVQDLFTDSESMLQFQRGVEEASKFLPKGNMLVVDKENKSLVQESTEKTSEGLVKLERKEKEDLSTTLGKKTRDRDETNLEEERSNKQYAVDGDGDGDESDLSEMFDKVFLRGQKLESAPCGDEKAPETEAKKLQLDGPINGSKGGKNRNKKQSGKREIVDLRTLLILCAQSVSADDRRTAGELLKKIRQHTSPLGDGSQRLAHCFANALEARLSGSGTQIYTALASKRSSAADMLKAYQVFMSACPFKKLAVIFANYTYYRLAEKADTIHIIDFGILYGFQWPALIYFLSKRPGGPPKLRITGIELPQRGLRPAERVQQTGRRLEKYCELNGVPFEYNAIAQKWDTIKVEDLKIKNDEVVAVNCIWRFKNLLDETVVVNSPRDSVLKLIRKIKPAKFVHSVVNGSYNAPFFVTRFKEALFHFSALFDMLDANLPNEDPMRLMFEKEFCGRQVMNVLACEGSERVERPETYKQWQLRNVRAGFRQLPLEPDLMKRLRCKLKAGCYHSDFMIDEDGHWMLQGWKGRNLFASSCWVPV